jgi:predicted transcriptional regulator
VRGVVRADVSNLADPPRTQKLDELCKRTHRSSSAIAEKT